MSHVSQRAAWTVPNGDPPALRLTVQVFLAQRDLRVDVFDGGTIVGEQGSTLLTCLSLLRFASPHLLPKRVSIDVLPVAGSVTVYAVCEDTFRLPKPASTAERYQQQFSEWLQQLGNHVEVQARLDQSLAMRRATGRALSRYERSAPWWIPSDEELEWSPDDGVEITDEVEALPSAFLEIPEASVSIGLDSTEEVNPDLEVAEQALASTDSGTIVEHPGEAAAQPTSAGPDNGSGRPEQIEAIEASEAVDPGSSVPEEVSLTREIAEEAHEQAADETPVESPEISAPPLDEQAVMSVEPGEAGDQAEEDSLWEVSPNQEVIEEPHEPAAVSEGEAAVESAEPSPSSPDEKEKVARWGGFKLPAIRLGSWLAASKASFDELPQTVRLEAAHGDECIDSGDWAGAVSHYDAALEAAGASRPKPNSPDADLMTQISLRRGMASFRHNQSLLDATKPADRSSVDLKRAIDTTRLAIQDYGEAIRLSPDLAQAYFRRGEAHLFIARCEHSRSSAKRANAELEAAVMDLTAAIELTPSFAAAFALRAIAHTLLNHEEEAEIDVGKAIALGTDHVTMWRALRGSKSWAPRIE